MDKKLMFPWHARHTRKVEVSNTYIIQPAEGLANVTVPVGTYYIYLPEVAKAAGCIYVVHVTDDALGGTVLLSPNIWENVSGDVMIGSAYSFMLQTVDEWVVVYSTGLSWIILGSNT